MNLLRTSPGRHALFALYYAVEGAPIGFLWWALPTLLGVEGLPVGRVAATSALLALPWALKALWAPLIDLGAGGRLGLKPILVAAQLVMAAALVPAAFLDPREHYGPFLAALLVHAFAASTQDAAIDALAIRAAPERERGSLNGWMQAGMLLARSAFGGGILLFAEPLGRRGLMLLLALAILLSTGLAFLWRTPDFERGRLGIGAWLGALGDVLRRRTSWLGLVLALAAGAAFESAGGLAGLWLVHRGAPPVEAARLFGLVAPGAMLLGALAGGYASDLLGRRRAVLLAGLALAGAAFALAARAELAGPIERTLLLGLVYLGSGLVTASTYALFMELTDRRLGATQFSVYMGATNLCESWSVALGGALAAGGAWSAAFGVPAAIGLVALLALAPLGPAFRAPQATRAGGADA